MLLLINEKNWCKVMKTHNFSILSVTNSDKLHLIQVYNIIYMFIRLQFWQKKYIGKLCYTTRVINTISTNSAHRKNMHNSYTKECVTSYKTYPSAQLLRRVTQSDWRKAKTRLDYFRTHHMSAPANDIVVCALINTKCAKGMRNHHDAHNRIQTKIL